MTLEQMSDWYERHARAERAFWFTIYQLPDLIPIGIAGLHQIDVRNRTGTYAVMIGERPAHGKGYGTETTRLMLDYAFAALGLHNVLLRVDEYNLAAIRAYQKAGLCEVGRRRQSLWMGGKFWDEIYMDCLSTEFSPSVVASIFTSDEPRT